MSEYKTVLVTGATSGIGYATVRKLAEDGFDVYAVGRQREKLETLCRDVGARAICADVREFDNIVAQLDGAPIDILVNNAGILSTRALFHQIDPSEIDAMIDINLKAPMHLTCALLPGMVERKRGHLVFLGSTGGHSAFPNMAAYGPSKAGISLFCDNLRCDLLGTSVRVSEIVPGRVQTDLYRDALGRKQANAALYDGFRSVQPAHVAGLISTIIALPSFVDVSRLEVVPTDQASGGGIMVKTEQ